MRGDKATPIALKVLRMSSRKAQTLLAKESPTPGPLTEAPAWLTPDQKTAWQYCIANAPREVLRNIDKAILAGWVVAEDTHRQAATLVQRTQLLVKSPKQGAPQQSPYLAIMNRQFVLMLRAAAELGFTPCSRARIDAGKAPQAPANDWDDLG